jgi:hypothetical protein
VVATALKKGGVSNHANGHLIEDIRTTFLSFLLVEVSHVREKLIRQPTCWLDVLLLSF